MARKKRVRCIQLVHDAFDPIADRGEPVVGGLRGLNLQGTLFYMVHRGPYHLLGAAWERFWEKFAEQGEWAIAGAPGDVYICPPEPHEEEEQATLLTLLWCPVARISARPAKSPRKRAPATKRRR